VYVVGLCLGGVLGFGLCIWDCYLAILAVFHCLHPRLSRCLRVFLVFIASCMLSSLSFRSSHCFFAPVAVFLLSWLCSRHRHFNIALRALFPILLPCFRSCYLFDVTDTLFQLSSLYSRSRCRISPCFDVFDVFAFTAVPFISRSASTLPSLSSSPSFRLSSSTLSPLSFIIRRLRHLRHSSFVTSFLRRLFPLLSSSLFAPCLRHGRSFCHSPSPSSFFVVVCTISTALFAFGLPEELSHLGFHWSFVHSASRDGTVWGYFAFWILEFWNFGIWTLDFY
jgi:hypothetical protein